MSLATSQNTNATNTRLQFFGIVGFSRKKWGVSPHKTAELLPAVLRWMASEVNPRIPDLKSWGRIFRVE